MEQPPKIVSSHPDGSQSNRAYQNKRAKVEEKPTSDVSSLPAKFVTVEGGDIGPHLDLPLAATPEKLEKLINQLSALTKKPGDDGDVPYAFYIQVMLDMSR